MKNLFSIFFLFICHSVISSTIEKSLATIFFLDESKIDEVFYELNLQEKYLLISESVDTSSLLNIDSISAISIPNEILYKKGVEDATNFYHAPVIYYGSYLTGCTSSFILGMLGGIVGENAGCVLSSGCIPGAISPAFYLIFINMLNVSVKDYMVTHKSDKENSDYIKGFKKEAKRKKIRNSMIGTVVGMALGVATSVLFFDTIEF